MTIFKNTLPAGWRKSRYFGSTIYHIKDEDILKQVNNGKYEIDSIQIVKEWWTESCLGIDIGANIGLFSIQLVNETQGKQIHVYAFEPNPITFTKLQLSIIDNKLEKFITPFPIALSDKQRLTKFAIHQEKSSSGDGLIDTGRAGKTEQIIVPTTTIDNFMEVFQIERLNWIKMDVEGAELLVLRGAITSLKKYRPKIIFEIHRENIKAFGFCVEDIYAFFQETEYRIMSVDKQLLDLYSLRRYVNDNIGCGNYLAIPKDH